MKIRPRIVPVLILAWMAMWLGAGALLLAGAGGCAGDRARSTVGVTALEYSVPGIVEDAAAGIETMPESDRPVATQKLAAFKAAIDSKDREAIHGDALPRWGDVRLMAEAGIAAREAAGTLGHGGAASRRERLDRFHDVLVRTSGPDP